MLFVRGVLAAALLVIVLPLGINGKTRHSRRLNAAKKGKKQKGNKAAKKSAKKIVESTATSESTQNLFPFTQVGQNLESITIAQNLEEAASFDCENSFLEYYNAEIGSFTSLSADNNEQAKNAIIEVLLEIGSDVGFDCEFDETFSFSTTSALEKAREECVADLTALLENLNDCDLKAGFVNAVAAEKFVSSVLWPSTPANAVLAVGFGITGDTTGDALKAEADAINGVSVGSINGTYTGAINGILTGGVAGISFSDPNPKYAKFKTESSASVGKPTKSTKHPKSAKFTKSDTTAAKSTESEKGAVTPVKNSITVDVQSENTAADLAAAISNGPVSVSIEADSGIFVGACEENNYPSFVEFADKLGLLEGILGDKFFVYAFEDYQEGVSPTEDNVLLFEQQYEDENVGFSLENTLVVQLGSVNGIQEYQGGVFSAGEQDAELNAKAKEALIGFILNSGPDIEPCGFEGDFSCGEWNEEEFESNEEQFESFDRLDDCVLKAGLEKVVAAASFFASLLEG